MTLPPTAGTDSAPSRDWRPWGDRGPELFRTLLVTLVFLVAVAAALAPIVYLLRRLGVG